MSEQQQIEYQCVRCGKQAPLSEWLRIDLPGQFKCPRCGFRVARKVKPPVVKRIKAV